jgi:hypothetical protein
VARELGGGCGGIGFVATPFACWSGAGGGQAAHLADLTLLRRPKSCERRGSRVPVILPNGRPDGQAGRVARLCLPEPDIPPPLSCDGGGEGEDGVLPTIQGRGSKGHGCPAEKTNVREAGSRVRPQRGPSQTPKGLARRASLMGVGN